MSIPSKPFRDHTSQNLEQLFSTESLESILVKDARKCEKEDLDVMWYHGKLSRNNAEHILADAMRHNPTTDSDGMFLVRDNTASDTDFSLSFMYEHRCYHFYIQRSKEGYFGIEGGPVVQGLDKLIEHYMEAANRLPTRLTKICKGRLPPARVRRDGPTNILHKVINSDHEDLAVEILNHRLCPDVNAKNKKGSTALHDAAFKGMQKAVSAILSQDPDITIRDCSGATPLHKACEANRVAVAVQLIRQNPHCIQEKVPDTDWVPLHTAVTHGNVKCAKVLLDAGAALYPRGCQGETPIELAEQYRYQECVELFEMYKEPPANFSKADWFHQDLDRQGAENVFNNQNAKNGLFLIRPTKNVKNAYVLSLFKERTVYHYEIKSKTYRNQLLYYIEGGPMHRSLEQLIQYFHRFEDGLGYPLTASVSTDGVVKVLHISENYSNFTSVAPQGNPTSPSSRTAHSRQKLPDRPPDLEAPPEIQAPSPPPSTPSRVSPSLPPMTPQDEEPEPLKEINRKNLRLGSELGQGEYGSVLKGVLTQEKKLFRGKKVEVAVKTFHSVGNVEDFKFEAHVMQSLKNNYIVELLGVCQGPPLMLVEEFLPLGSMLNYLEDHREQVRVKEELNLWAAQIAMGMVYLESKRLVHRDLAARNILLHSLQRVKISDFGLSRAMGTDKDYYKASKGGRWPIKWYAPESVNFGHFSHPSDVWSYGVTLWEMFSYAGAPYENMTGVEVIKFIEDGHRLDQPVECPDVVYEVMLKCWSYKPADRPTFSWLTKHFDEEPEYTSAREVLKMSHLKDNSS